MNASELWREVERLRSEARHAHEAAMWLGMIGMIGGIALLGFFFFAPSKLAQSMTVGFTVAFLAVGSQVGAWVLMLVASRKMKRLAKLRETRRQLAREIMGHAAAVDEKRPSTPA
jgi:protein-S-isoprenylcysteine O-methyltransferase Ste14